MHTLDPTRFRHAISLPNPVRLSRLRYLVGTAASEHHLSHALYHFRMHTQNLLQSPRAATKTTLPATRGYPVRATEVRFVLLNRSSHVHYALGDWSIRRT
jgi:hypothetical protein